MYVILCIYRYNVACVSSGLNLFPLIVCRLYTVFWYIFYVANDRLIAHIRHKTRRRRRKRDSRANHTTHNTQNAHTIARGGTRPAPDIYCINIYEYNWWCREARARERLVATTGLNVRLIARLRNAYGPSAGKTRFSTYVCLYIFIYIYRYQIHMKLRAARLHKHTVHTWALCYL